MQGVERRMPASYLYFWSECSREKVDMSLRNNRLGITSKKEKIDTNWPLAFMNMRWVTWWHCLYSRASDSPAGTRDGTWRESQVNNKHDKRTRWKHERVSHNEQTYGRKVGDRISLTFGLLFGIRRSSSYSTLLPIPEDPQTYWFHAIDRQGFDSREYIH